MPSEAPAQDVIPADDVIDVVVPVYNNFADAHRLFAHLSAAANEYACRLVVIDDASPEAAALIPPEPGGYLTDVLFIRNEQNLGFAGTVNKAMRLSERDIVLLNTDTLVFDGWLDRLRGVSRSRPRVGTVTPLSNAATILSYPTFPAEYKAELEIDWRSFDRLCAAADSPPIEIPTGIGFCMLITRACIDAVGHFDDVTFRRGYGEECDFCRRAASKGWANLAAPNVFVWHRGEGSFGGRARELRDDAQRALHRLHPDYPSLVATFISNDPIRPARRALDAARIAADSRLARLHLCVDTPEQQNSAFKEMFFAREGKMRPRYQPVIAGFGPLPNLFRLPLMGPSRDLERFLRETGIKEVVVYPSQGIARLLFTRLARTAKHLGLRVVPAAA